MYWVSNNYNILVECIFKINRILKNLDNIVVVSLFYNVIWFNGDVLKFLWLNDL